MKMSEKTLLKKIEQAFKENYDNGSYEIKVDVTSDTETRYAFFYTYETGETIGLHIDVTRLGEVKFYSPVHCYYISNFSNHIKSVINVCRMLFELLECNKKQMINHYEIETSETSETEETEETEDNEETTYHDEIDTIQPRINIDTDNIKYLMETHSFPSTPTHEPTCKKVKTSSIYGMFGQFPTIPDMYNNKCFCCPADRQGNRCGGEKWCKETWKRYEAIIKPDWHNVSLATLANIDFDMLDEKRQSYLTIYRELQKTVNNARKCKTIGTFDRCTGRLRSKALKLHCNNEISVEFYHFITLKLSMLNVEYGLYDSSMEFATGLHKSRRYNKNLL